MTYIPHSLKERDAMLEKIGVKNLDELFAAVPAKHRFPTLNLPEALTEMEAASELGELAEANESTKQLVSFLGAGMYNHYIPSVVDHILRRGEFYTAYTPYQPEISQGTLQAIFEYQSLMSALTGMDVSNASHYDGATAAAEAVNLAWAQFRGKRTKVVVSPTVHPQYREVIRTYTQGMELELAGETVADLEAGPEHRPFSVGDEIRSAQRRCPYETHRKQQTRVAEPIPRDGREGVGEDSLPVARDHGHDRSQSSRHPEKIYRPNVTEHTLVKCAAGLLYLQRRRQSVVEQHGAATVSIASD